MFGLETLDVLIGLVTIYLVFALACTSIIEVIVFLTNKRAENLKKGLEMFLSGTLHNKDLSFIDSFYQHPLIRSLSRTPGRLVNKLYNGRCSLPTHIPADVVSEVIHDLIGNSVLDKKQALSLIRNNATNESGVLDKQKFLESVQKHYLYLLDRVSGRNKRFTQTWAIILSALIVIPLNVDTIDLFRTLSKNAETREKILRISDSLVRKHVAVNLQERKPQEGIQQNASEKTKLSTTAESVDKSSETGLSSEEILSEVQQLEASGIQLGWKVDAGKTVTAQNATGPSPIQVISPAPAKAPGQEKTAATKQEVTDGRFQLPTNAELLRWATKFIGLLVSIMAISLGAPFWFDTLRKIMDIRVAGRKSDLEPKPATREKQAAV